MGNENDCLQEMEGERIHDHFTATRCIMVPGAIIVGAGPSGLATAACLKEKGVPSLIIERANCIASLWKFKTYDRLRLHLPKHFCQLPFMLFPSTFPTYPTKQQFLSYLQSYADHFGLELVFNSTVVRAEYDNRSRFWRVEMLQGIEYLCRWLVVATGENAEEVVPRIEGMEAFRGPIVHSGSYKTGELFRDKDVLVVGCGNSGMEVSVDLCNYDARPSIVVRDTVHVLPQEMIGRSTFGVSMWLLKWLPVRIVDCFLLVMARLMLGDTCRLGLNRPKLGPLALKNSSGKTPVLDIGTLAKIRSGHVKVYPGINRLTQQAVEFIDGRIGTFDAIILATGFKSNVPHWLKGNEMFSDKDGFPNGWKGGNGLYAVGFSKRGLLGSSIDAKRIAEDIEHQWSAEVTKAKLMAFSCSALLPHQAKT